MVPLICIFTILASIQSTDYFLFFSILSGCTVLGSYRGWWLDHYRTEMVSNIFHLQEGQATFPVHTHVPHLHKIQFLLVTTASYLFPPTQVPLGTYLFHQSPSFLHLIQLCCRSVSNLGVLPAKIKRESNIKYGWIC